MFQFWVCFEPEKWNVWNYLYFTDEEVKKYWASVYRAEESNTVSENAESSLKIEFLDDVSIDKGLNESQQWTDLFKSWSVKCLK